MKIGISCYPTFGGSGVVASELGMGLAGRGHEVHFITYDIPGRLNVYRPGIFFHEVSVPDYPLFEYPPYSLALATVMAECARREGLELIHAHYAIPHAASALLAAGIVGRDSLKVVTTLHGTDVTLVGRERSFMAITKYAIEQSDAVSTVSRFLRDDVCAAFSCDKQVDVIYNFIDPGVYERLDVEGMRKLLAPKGEKLLVHVSNYRKLKRVMDVMEVFLKVRRELPTRLVLVGTGPELTAVVERAQESGVDRDILPLGNRERVLDIIAAADLLLLPSETESFGMAALEAMACGVPPITTRTGGLPEVVDDGETGFLLPVGDTDGMTARALELLSDEAMRSKMGAAGRKCAREKFNITTALDAYEDLYRRALSSGTR